MDYNKIILNKVMDIRKEKHLSKRKLSTLLDKDETYWYKVEAQETNLSFNILFQVLEIFEMTPLNFFIECFKDEN